MNRAPISLAVLLAACSSEQRTGDAGPRPDAVAAPDATVDPPDAGPEVDAGSTRPGSCAQPAAWVTSLAGSILDENGAPSMSRAQLCIRTSPSNMLICLRPEEAAADGRFSISVPMTARCMTEATMRIVLPLADRSVSYCHIELPTSAEVIANAGPFRIFPTQRATTLPPLGTATMQRTVVFPGGVEMDLIPDNYFPGSGTYEDLAAGPIAAAGADECILAGEPRFDGIYGFSPEGDVQNQRVPLRLPNSAQLAANTPLAVFVLGGLGCTLDDGTEIPEGTWARIEDSAVSADGQTISITPGLPCLSWVAYRAL